ncbi:unnamed protein product, partial [marine sediment metagenome]
WLNIRFMYWHLQCGDPHWWNVKIRYNKFHKDLPEGIFAWYR